MKVKELIEVLGLEVLSAGETADVSIGGCFAGDLLSLAMSGVTASDAWVTVQTNLNILGIAALTEASCVIVANSMNVPENVVEKAKEESICLLRSDKGMYELCCLIGDNI